MERVLAHKLIQHTGERARVRGWLHTKRDFGKITFLILRDKSGLIQIVLDQKEEIQKVSSLQPGSILTVEGLVKTSEQAALQLELTDAHITVDVPITTPPPIEYYKPEIPTDLENILDHRAIALRNTKLQRVFEAQAHIVRAFRDYMYGTVHACEYFPPNIIGASSEGGAEFFHVDYFGMTATLAQSSQLYKQIMVGVNERVFALAPFFRKEPSHTPRHLAEGKQFEFEMGFFDDWKEILDIQEGVIQHILQTLRSAGFKQEELIIAPEGIPFPRITFQEAQTLFFERTGIDERNEDDLSPAAERELCRWALETQGTQLVFVTDWKTSKRPFYAYPKDNDPAWTNTFDLLCAGSEITSGGQRRHTYDSMVQGIVSKGMDPKEFEEYLSIFKYGMPPHGGFGMGLERLTMTLLQLKNVREAALFPSDTKRIASQRIRAKIFFGGENIRNEIIRLLRAHNMPFEHKLHATQEERGSAPEEGIKALILRGKTSLKNYQFNLPSHMQLNHKAVTELVGEKCEFEDPAVIEERFGLIIGGVPPFGNLLNIDTFFDESLNVQGQRGVFNCGLQTESIFMDKHDLVELVKPKWGRFTKS